MYDLYLFVFASFCTAHGIELDPVMLNTIVFHVWCLMCKLILAILENKCIYNSRQTLSYL